MLPYVWYSDDTLITLALPIALQLIVALVAYL